MLWVFLQPHLQGHGPHEHARGTAEGPPGTPPLCTPTPAYPQGAAEGGCPQVECPLLLCVHLSVLHIHLGHCFTPAMTPTKEVGATELTSLHFPPHTVMSLSLFTYILPQ